MFQLTEVVDELYRVAYSKGPFPATGIEINDFFRMCFLICHRSLLSAAMCTGKRTFRRWGRYYPQSTRSREGLPCN